MGFFQNSGPMFQKGWKTVKICFFGKNLFSNHFLSLLKRYRGVYNKRVANGRKILYTLTYPQGEL